ncbi:unnamed protein product, partial [Rotaria magnacalcarata]
SISHDPSSLTLYGTVPMNRSFPYSLMNTSKAENVTLEQLNNEELLDHCRDQCLVESNKALDLLKENFDQKSSATSLIRSI